MRMGPVAGENRGLPAPSIVGSFFLLPWLGYAADSVVPNVYPLVLVAAQVPLAARHEDVQNDNRRTTTPGELTDVGTAAPSPRCDEPTRLSHGGWSDSLAR